MIGLMKKRTAAAGERGFSLPEVMISATLGMVVLGAALDAFVTHHIRFRGQQAKAELQQDLRGGVALLARELRLAGAGEAEGHAPVTGMAADEVAFVANVNDVRGSLTAPAAFGQDRLEVLAGSGWAKGKRIVVCGPAGCEEHILARDGSSTRLVLMEHLKMDFPVGSRVEVVNSVRYYLSRSDPRNPKLMREVDRGANPLIEHVEMFSLTFLGESGEPATAADEVRLVRVRLATVGDDGRGGRVRRTHMQEMGVRAL